MRKFKELDRFLLVTAYATDTYQVLFAYIPEIDQVQCVGRCFKNKWEVFDHGYRTIKEKLPNKWVCPLKIEELTYYDVKTICPAVLNLDFSTKMLEDMKIRRLCKWKQLMLQLGHHVLQ